MFTKFKVEDLVRIFNEPNGWYHTIESIFVREVDGKEEICYYLKNCYIEYVQGKRLYFLESELELFKEFYWIKKSNDG